MTLDGPDTGDRLVAMRGDRTRHGRRVLPLRSTLEEVPGIRMIFVQGTTQARIKE